MTEVAIPSPLFIGSWHDSRRWTRSRRAVAKRPARSRCASRLQNRIMAAGDRPVYCRLSQARHGANLFEARRECGVAVRKGGFFHDWPAERSSSLDP